MRIPLLLRSGFGFLLVSDLLTVLALMIGNVAVPWWIAQHGGAGDLARYGVTMASVSVIAMPLLSPLGDRHSKRMLIASALACFAASAVVLAWWAGAHGYRLGVLIAIQVVPFVSLALIQPASNGYVAELVPAGDLMHAMSWQQSAQAIGRLIGPTLGGIALAAFGTAPTLWLYAAMLALAAAFATRLPAPARAAGTTSRSNWRADLVAGLRANWSIPIERGWITANFVSWVFLFPTFTMLVPLKVQSLHLSALWLGLCEAALSLGVLLGALGVSAALIARFGRFKVRVGSAASQGAVIALAGVTTWPFVMVAAFAVAGVASSAMLLVGLGHRTLARPAAFRARMSAAAMMTTQVAATLGPALAGAALTVWPLDVVYPAFGLVGGLAALSLAAVPGFREFMALDHREVDGWYGRTYPQVFGRAARE